MTCRRDWNLRQTNKEFNMKAAETLIAWNAINHERREHCVGPAGSIVVGPLLRDVNAMDWTQPYGCTGGAALTYRHKLRGIEQEREVLMDFYKLVYSYGLQPYVVHRAFLHIDEYQKMIKLFGLGPDRGEVGHDPQAHYGRVISTEVPEVDERHAHGGIHIWPTGQMMPYRKEGKKVA
jgi:hypothetical protein